MDFLTTREVAAYLRINEKKVYALLSEDQIPATRVSGKWLFEKALIDRWMTEKTVYPATGLLGGLLNSVLIIQGSDDILLDSAINGIRDQLKISIAGIKVGSIGGLDALTTGRAHAAVFHLEAQDVPKALKKLPCYVIDLFKREQGFAFHPGHLLQCGTESVRELLKPGARFASRQKNSGTWKLTEKVFKKENVTIPDLTMVGPFSSHLGAALAVMNRDADATITIRAASDACGLDFIPIEFEEFRMVIHSDYFSHPNMREFLDLLLLKLKETNKKGAHGYTFASLGRLSASMKD